MCSACSSLGPIIQYSYVAAVQSERRRGRPSLNGIKKKVNCRQSSYEGTHQAQIIQTNCPPVNNNLLIDDQDNVLGEGCGQTGDLMNENVQVFNSLNELKYKLRKKPRVSYTTPFVNPCIFEDLPPSLVSFQLLSNLPPPHKPDSHYVCETASRILFLSVHWAKKISVFHSLPSSTQVSLLRTSWADLFILGLVQCRDQVSLPVVLTFIATHLHTCLTMDSLSLSRSRDLVNTLTRVRDIVNRITELALEPEEYAYLRLTYLFGPDQTSPSLQKLNDCVLSAFTAYYERNPVLGEGRLAKLILRTAPLRYCTQDRLEELFFSGLIGDVKIDGVIPYILDMEVEGGKVDEEDFVQENVLEKNNE